MKDHSRTKTVSRARRATLPAAISLLISALLPALGQPALAQRSPARPHAPTQGPALAPNPAGSAASSAGSPTADDLTPEPVPTELTQVHPGGLTANQVGARAAATSYSAKANEEALRGAAARVDEAWASFLPRLSGTAKYTRLSNFTVPTFPGPVPISIPLVLDNWLLQASINVPISDYLLKIDQAYTAATSSMDAARWDVVAARATASANGRVAYFTWLRARGAVIVAIQAVNDQKTHLRDARNQFEVGNASKADVLRAETALASAQLAVQQAKDLADLSETQVRVAMHVGDAPFQPGEDLEASLPAFQGDLRALIAEALTSRAEIKSADANAESTRKQASATRAGRYPSLSAFADAIEGNPNPRYFPPSSKWFPTWDIGAQITWSPNDILIAGASAADTDSRAGQIEANRNEARDNIEVEVTQAMENVHTEDFSIEASTRELASAEEAHRVARELFNNGRGTSTTLTDAETDLTRARLDLLNARADARIARIRLEHALGRDVQTGPR